MKQPAKYVSEAPLGENMVLIYVWWLPYAPFY